MSVLICVYKLESNPRVAILVLEIISFKKDGVIGSNHFFTYTASDVLQIGSQSKYVHTQ